jgi:hypothetical protein
VQLTLLRWIGAGLVLAAGAVHLYLYFDYFHRIATIGPLFLLNAAGGAGVAVWVAARDRLAPLLAGLGFAVATLAGFFLSVAVGLFGYHERLRGPWQETAGLIEALAVVAFCTLLAARARGRVTSGAHPRAV